MRGPGSVRDPAVRAVLPAAVAVATIASLHDPDPGPPSVGQLLASSRFVDVGLYLVAVAGAVVGARVASLGLATTWWTAGADRIDIVTRALAGAGQAALAVVVAWWAADAVTTVVVRGLPAEVGSPAGLARLVAVELLGAAVFGALGLLLGLALRQVPRAVAVVSVATLPFAAEGLDLVAAARGPATLLSPFGAARAVVLTGSGNDLFGVEVDRSLAVAGAVATLAWGAALWALAMRASSLPPAATGRRRRWPVPALALAAIAALGAVGPHALAPDVAWPLRPEWRHAEAQGTSSRQQALAWLACRRELRRSCRPYEWGQGLILPEATRQVLARGRGTSAPPVRFQSSPEVVSALVELTPERSGSVLVVGATITLHLRSDRSGRWTVDGVSPVRAVVG